MEKNRAFSLVELMVVIALVGILSAVAVPSYRSYKSKVQFSQAMNFMGYLKTRAQDYYDRTGAWPTAAQLGFAASGTSISSPTNYLDFVTSITLETAAITGTCAGLNTRGAASVTLDPSKVYGINANYTMYLQWGVTPAGVIVTFCNDSSPGGNDWTGTNCTYPSNATAFFNSLC